MKLFDLSGKTALITGSSRGLGYTMATGLGKAGATIILNGRNVETLEKAVENFKKQGIKASYKIFSVKKEDEVIKGIDEIFTEIGAIDILINNAGIGLRNPLEDYKLEDWNELIDTHLTGSFLVARSAVKGMIRQKSGKIINICSVMSELGRETTGAYAAAKGGLKMLTRSMAVEWAKHNIQVNGIGPGYFATDLTRPLAKDPTFNSWLVNRTPARRWGNPEELVGPAIFLASEASSFVNGHILNVDGGFLVSV